MGANSFDQRHTYPAQGGAPDHIAILAVAALYESGVVGFAGLTIGFGLILLALWRASRRSATGPMAAAYLGSLVSLLVAYQATNALNFSLIWLIAGAGLAMALGKTADADSAHEETPGNDRDSPVRHGGPHRSGRPAARDLETPGGDGEAIIAEATQATDGRLRGWK